MISLNKNEGLLNKINIDRQWISLINCLHFTANWDWVKLEYQLIILPILLQENDDGFSGITCISLLTSDKTFILVFLLVEKWIYNL